MALMPQAAAGGAGGKSAAPAKPAAAAKPGAVGVSDPRAQVCVASCIVLPKKMPLHSSPYAPCYSLSLL